MADAPEALTYADLIMAQSACGSTVAWLREVATQEGVSPDTRATLSERIVTYDALIAKLNEHAVHLLKTGDYEAQRAELYR